MNLPSDLPEQIKRYVKDKGFLYDEKKVFYYIDCTVDPKKLVFEKWTYDFQPPTEKYFLKK